MTQGSFDKLLQTGEYTVREKWTNRRVGWFAGAYWCLVTAVYLAVSFWNNNWEKSWIIWAVAGLVFAALYSAVRAWADRKISKRTAPLSRSWESGAVHLTFQICK